MKSIKKGQQYRCVKDYIMDDGTLAYKSGWTYEATGKNTLPSLFDPTHQMDKSDDFKDHFKRVKNNPEAYIQNIPVIFDTVKVDSVVESVIKKFKSRSDVGIKKYGTTLDRNDINFDGWAEHLQQELMDGILYLERLRRE